MARRLQRILLTGLWLLGLPVAAVAADEQPPSEAASSGWLLDDQVAGSTPLPDPSVERREVRLDRIDTEDFEFGAWTGLLAVEDFGVEQVNGAGFTYHVTEDLFLEANWATTELGLSSYELLSGDARLIADDERNLTRYGVGVGWTVLPGEGFIGSRWAVDTGLYLVGGVGNTRFAGEDRLTISVGGGYRILANDFISLHLDVRDHIFDSELFGVSETTHNLEVRTGITLFF